MLAPSFARNDRDIRVVEAIVSCPTLDGVDERSESEGSERTVADNETGVDDASETVDTRGEQGVTTRVMQIKGVSRGDADDLPPPKQPKR